MSSRFLPRSPRARAKKSRYSNTFKFPYGANWSDMKPILRRTACGFSRIETPSIHAYRVEHEEAILFDRDADDGALSLPTASRIGSAEDDGSLLSKVKVVVVRRAQDERRCWPRTMVQLSEGTGSTASGMGW